MYITAQTTSLIHWHKFTRSKARRSRDCVNLKSF